MSQNLSVPVTLITSSSATYSRNFGTGFTIYQDEQGTYLLTCAHVVRDVGGSEQIMADGMPATVIASGKENSFDLAVLRVEGLREKPPLKLRATGKENKPFIIAGFHELDQKNNRLLRNIMGNLGEQTELCSSDGRQRINAWDLMIEGKHYLEPGYSGSPVIDKETDFVLGVVSHRIGKGEKGLAISIDALKEVWLEMPKNLIVNSRNEKPNKTLPPSVQIKIERLERDRNLAQKQSNELTELIQLIVDGIEENRDDNVRQYSLNRKKKRYEEERCLYDQEVERLQAEIDKLFYEYL